MFYIIGVGLTPKQITLEAINAIKKCKFVYLDNFTSIFSQGYIEDLEKIINKKIIKLNRIELEQKQEFIKENSCLLVIGNVFSATTHYSIFLEAINKKINIRTLPGISIFNYKASCGLSEYKFGKTTSIVYPLKNYKPTSFYKTILDNLKIGAHTMCLLDIKTKENKFMSIKEACEILDDIDTKGILKNKKIVGIFGAGSEDMKILSLDFKDYKKINLKKYPQTLIICGELNEFERDALNELRIN